jgi:hypothetical protein
MDLQVILGSFGHWHGGFWLKSLKNSPLMLFLPQASATNPTLHDHHRPDDHLRTTVHHSLDPLGAGEMDLQVILCRSFVRLQDLFKWENCGTLIFTNMVYTPEQTRH